MRNTAAVPNVVRRCKGITVLAVWLTALLVVLPAHAQQAQPTPAAPVVVAPQVLESGVNALNAEDFDRAILDFSLYVLLNPTASQGYFGRALGYSGREDVESALESFNRALEIAPEAPAYRAELLRSRARLFAGQERYDEALADFAQVIELEPTADNYAQRAVLYIQMEDYAPAVADLDAALELGSDPALNFYRALAQNRLENAAEAAVDYRAFLSQIETRIVQQPELRSGDIVRLDLSEGVVHRFSFRAKAGQRLNLLAAAQGAGTADPLVIVADSTDTPLIADDDTGGGLGAVDAAIFNYVIPEDGLYTLLVSHSLGGVQGQIAVGIELRDEE